MPDLFLMDEYQVQALVICLIVSVIWAPIVLLTARWIAQGASISARQAIWIGALVFAVAPSALAPGLAGLGVSLRAGNAFETQSLPYAPVELAGDVNRVAKGAATSYVVAIGGDESVASRVETAIAEVDPVTAFDERMLADGESSNWAVAEGLTLREAARRMTRADATRSIAILYAYGAVLAGMIWVGRAAGLNWVAGTGRPVLEASIIEGVEEWRRAIGVKHAPRLRHTRHVSSVCVFGVVRPIVLIPSDIEARVSQDDIIMMCAHELAHIRRRDTQLFFATALVRALFWFNPAVKIVAAHVEQSAEEAADAHVLSRGVDRRAYASCFVKSLRFAAEKAARRPAMTPTFTPIDRHGRRRRLDAILQEKRAEKTGLTGRIIAGGAGLAMMSAAVAQAGFAVSPSSIENRPELVARLQAALTPVPPAPPVASGTTGVFQIANAATPVEPQPSAPAFSTPSPSAAPLPAEPSAVGSVPTAVTEPEAPVAFVAPARGRISLAFGARSPRHRTPHSGVDIAARNGAPVVAAGEGVVVSLDNIGRGSIGKYVKIGHGNGVYTKYLHLSRVDVASGDVVKAGQGIAAVGNTGISSGPHLHFELIREGRRIDPSTLIDFTGDWSDSALDDAPQAPTLKTDAIDSLGIEERLASTGRPVRLAFSTASAGPAPAAARDFEYDFDASGRETAARLQMSALVEATSAASANSQIEASSDVMRSAFARMEAELSEARSRRATVAAARRTNIEGVARSIASSTEQLRDVEAMAEARAEAARERAEATRERAAKRAEAVRERTETARLRAHLDIERARADLEEKFCCGRVEPLVDAMTAQVEASIERAFARLSETEFDLDGANFAAEASDISRHAIEAARTALALGAESDSSLEAAHRRIADQEAEIARLKSELEAAKKNDR
ncbi:MAG: peptidoglycan DD-metalloendopeptidase family protein [Alphaproteobacteria bacterium]|nr:peptidoglycan DD-metalloendopeptidase family protein [Alphaproteobacteria bacterium]